MVEFALVVPLFLALVLGIISYGYMLSYRQAVSQAAMEGARAAALAPQGAPDVDDRALGAVNRSLEGYGVSCTSGGHLMRDGASVGSCDIPAEPTTCPDPNPGSKSCVEVRIEHDYRDHPLIPSFPGLGISLPSTLEYSAVVEAN